MTKQDTDALTPKQTQAIAALLSTATLDLAAKQTGVNVRTLNRWLKLDPFRQALANAESELRDNLYRRILAMGNDALDALGDVLKTPAQMGANVKRLAASDILSRIHEWSDFLDFESRIAALEAAQYDTQNPT